MASEPFLRKAKSGSLGFLMLGSVLRTTAYDDYTAVTARNPAQFLSVMTVLAETAGALGLEFNPGSGVPVLFCREEGRTALTPWSSTSLRFAVWVLTTRRLIWTVQLGTDCASVPPPTWLPTWTGSLNHCWHHGKSLRYSGVTCPHLSSTNDSMMLRPKFLRPT